MFTIKDLKRYRKCPRLFHRYYTQDIQEIDFIKMDEDVSELIIEKLDLKNPYIALEDEDFNSIDAEHILNVNFKYQELSVTVPYMRKIKDSYDIYFFDTSVEPKVSKIKDYVIINWVLQKNNVKTDRMKVIYLNKKFIKGDYESRSTLLKVTGSVYSHGHYVGNITKLINRKKEDYTKNLLDMKKIVGEKEPPKASGCNIKTKCDFREYCYNLDELPADSILYLYASSVKYDLYKKGIRTFLEADPEMLEGNKIQYQQILAARKGGLSFDRMSLNMWLKQFDNQKITFIDFEWETYAVPKYEGLSPYDVMCFQYSMDILHLDGSLEHHEYIGQNDTRYTFIRNLLHDIDKNSVIVAYNASGAEKIRLMELAEQFPEYQNELEDIAARMTDISVPFINGMVYDLNMRGSYTLKAVYNAISSKGNYDNLNISTAMDAVKNWRDVDDLDDERNRKVKEDLLRYCGLDTKSMVVIYKWLRDIVK